MKKAPVFFLLICCLFLSACSSLPTLESVSENEYRLGNTLYVAAPMTLEAVSHASSPKAKMKDGVEETKLYAVGNCALCNDSCALFIEKGMPIPSVSDFAPTSVLLCEANAVTAVLNQITDATVAQTLLDITTGAGTSPSDVNPEWTCTRYLLKFTSEKFPKYFYCLEYRIYQTADEKESVCLFDREQNLLFFLENALG